MLEKVTELESVVGNEGIVLVRPDLAPVKQLIPDECDRDQLGDATYGRRTHAVIVTNLEHILLSAIQSETVTHNPVCGVKCDSISQALQKARIPARRGKKAISGFYEPVVSKQLRMLAVEEDTTFQALPDYLSSLPVIFQWILLVTCWPDLTF